MEPAYIGPHQLIRNLVRNTERMRTVPSPVSLPQFSDVSSASSKTPAWHDVMGESSSLWCRVSASGNPPKVGDAGSFWGVNCESSSSWRTQIEVGLKAADVSGFCKSSLVCVVESSLSLVNCTVFKWIVARCPNPSVLQSRKSSMDEVKVPLPARCFGPYCWKPLLEGNKQASLWYFIRFFSLLLMFEKIVANLLFYS